MKQFFLAFLLLCGLTLSIQAQQTVFVPSCNGTNDTAAFSTIVTTTGSNDATIRIPYKANTAQRCAVNTLSLPSRITVDNSDGSGVKVNTGQTLTVAGPRVNPIGKTMFFNVGGGQGTLVLTGRAYDSMADAANPGLVTTTTSNSQAISVNDTKVTADQAANVASIRTLGTGALQAAAGNDPRMLTGTTSVICAGVDDTTALNAALAAGGTVVITQGSTCAASSSFSFTSSSAAILRIEKGGLFKSITGQTPVIGGYLDAGVYQIFTNALAGQGTVSLLGRAVQEVYPEWWGASPAASAAVNTPALQAAIIGAYGNTRTNPSGLYIYNRVLKFSGMYDINNELQVYHMIGFRWEGQNKFNSGIRQTATNKRIIDGQSVAYGVFSNMRFSTNASQSGTNMALVDLDYSGAQGEDLRPQNITFQDCVIDGNQVGYIGIIFSKSGGGAQGDNIRIEKTYLSGFLQAGAQLGGGNDGTPTALAFNAINVQFKGGDIQSCPKYGLASYGGNWLVEDVTMENNSPPTQTGYDVFCVSPIRQCVVRNMVSESIRQTYGVTILENVEHQGGANLWPAAQQSGLVATNLLTGTHIGGDGKTYQVTVGGTFGGLSTTSATSGSATTVVNSGAAWTVNAFVGYRASIMSGPGKYQYGIITSNTATTITVAAGWVTDYQNITLADPTSSSTFVVEPNWGTQFTSGTVTWALLDYFSIDGATGLRLYLRNVKVAGKVKAEIQFSDIQGLTVNRTDWVSGNQLDGGVANSHVSRVVVARKGSDPFEGGEFTLPWAFSRNGGTGFTDLSQNQKGREWNVWSRGQTGGGQMFPELGIGPGDNRSQTVSENNVLAYLGRWGRKTPFGTNQAGTDTEIEAGRSTGSGSPGAIKLYVGTAGSSGASQNVGTEKLRVDTKGLSLLSALIYSPLAAAQITANQNNYNPGSPTPYLRLTSDASRNITGLTFTLGQADGQYHTIVNIGLNDIVLKHQDAASTAANRFLCSTAADITLTPKQAADILYDTANQYWIVWKKP